MILNTKQYSQTVGTIVLISVTILLVLSYFVTYNEIEQIKHEQYLTYSNNTKLKIDSLIENKKQLTTFIALALAQNETIVDALEKNNKELIDINYLSKIIAKKSSYKNLWFQVLDKNGYSFYRSWTKKSGDLLKNIRPEIATIIDQPQIISTISTGKFSMTFKSMVPIIDKNQKFIGIFEVISHFDSIQKKLLLEHNIDSVFLVDKEYKSQITKPLTNTFVNDYYVTVNTTNKEIFNILQKNGIEHYLKLEHSYTIHDDCPYLVIPYLIPDIDGNIMGYVLTFKPLNEIEINKAIYVKNNVAALLFIIVLIIVLIGYYLIYTKHHKYILLQNMKHQQNLIQSTKFQTIGEMAAGITHEINTPLTYIKGTIEMSKLDIEELPQSKIKTQLQDDFETIYNGVNRIAIIVQSMREMAQSEISTKEKYDVYTTLLTVLRMIYHKSKQITPIYINGKLFSMESSQEIHEEYISYIHLQRLEQVWTIILNNALDALQNIDAYDKRKIDIQIQKQDKNIIVRFIDNAGGIQKDILSKIFEPFVSTKQSSGIGIGLNVAKKIIDEHNATINVENTEDGACFTIVLDLIEE